MSPARFAKLSNAKHLAYLGVALQTATLLTGSVSKPLSSSLYIIALPIALFAYLRIASIIGATSGAYFWGAAGQFAPIFNSIILIIAAIKASDAEDDARATETEG